MILSRTKVKQFTLGLGIVASLALATPLSSAQAAPAHTQHTIKVLVCSHYLHLCGWETLPAPHKVRH